MNNHSDLVNLTLIRLSKSPSIRVWKNSTGVAKSMDLKRTISYGLIGSADILGIVRLDNGTGLYLAVEIKTGSGKQSIEQKNFEKVINTLGGLYIVIREKDDPLLIIKNKLQTRNLNQSKGEDISWE